MDKLFIPQALRSEHLSDARLFATREDMVSKIVNVPTESIAEIGVALGEFSEFLIRTLRPKLFVAFDVFDMHKYPEHWGTPSEIIFSNKTHHKFYVDRVSALVTELRTEVGRSSYTLERYRGDKFDLIYVDAGHNYEDVKSDAELSANFLNQRGTMIFNDYVMYDPISSTSYGVVHAVNELVMSGDWVVVGFALERNMFCDIALRRR